MRICVLQSSYEDSESSLQEVDTSFPNPGNFTFQHSFENRFIHKDMAKQEIDAVVAEQFDFYINFLWGTLDDDVAGIQASRYLESLGVPSAGIRSWERSRSKNDFYESALQRGAPPVPGKEKFPLFVKPANGCASQMINDQSLCQNEVELQGALRRINERLRDSRRRRGRALGKEDPQAYADSYDPNSRSSDDIVVQEYIDGRDYLVSVIAMGDSALALQPCVVNIRDAPNRSNFLTFDMKFDNQTRFEVISREDNPTLYDRLLEVALEAFETGRFCHSYMGCDVDMRVKPNGEVFAIEVNPQPACFLPDETGFADAPITESLPGGHMAVVNIFIANYFLQNGTLREWSKVAGIYDKMAVDYDEMVQNLSQIDDIMRKVTRVFDFEGTVVDLACGTGGFGRLLAECQPGRHHHREGQLIGFDLSPGMVDGCRAMGFYNEVYVSRMQTCLLEYTSHTEVDHIVCFSAIHFLSPEEFAFLLVSCFVTVRKSITIGVDEIPDVYNENLAKKGDSFMHSFNHLQNMEALGKPRGWSLVSRQRQYGWKSPATKDDVYTTTFRFERVDPKSIHDVRLARFATKD
jgi:SAM-dependent methyltransferase